MLDEERDMDRGVLKISAAERTAGPATPGMVRETAIDTDRMWAGFVTTAPGMISGWHHHGEYESAIYVMSGALRVEFGPGGTDRLDARPGDFLHVARGAVHREGNLSDEESHIIVVRSGSGPAVINVDGPAS